MSTGAAALTPQWNLEFGCRRLSDSERDAEDRVGAHTGLVVGAIGRDQFGVNPALVEGIEAGDGIGQFTVGESNSGEHTFAAETVAPISELDRFERTSRGATRHDGSTRGPRVECDLDFDGWVAARVEDFAGVDMFDDAHGAGGLLESFAREAIAPRAKGDGFRANRAIPRLSAA